MSSNQSRLSHTFSRGRGKAFYLYRPSVSFLTKQYSQAACMACFFRHHTSLTVQTLVNYAGPVCHCVDSEDSSVAFWFLWRTLRMLSQVNNGRRELFATELILERRTKWKKWTKYEEAASLAPRASPQGWSFSGFRHSVRLFYRLFLQTGLAKCVCSFLGLFTGAVYGHEESPL